RSRNNTPDHLRILGFRWLSSNRHGAFKDGEHGRAVPSDGAAASTPAFWGFCSMSDPSNETLFHPSRPSLPRMPMPLTLAVAILSMAALAPAMADDDNSNDAYKIGLWGDLPYSTLQATTGVPNLIADMNAHRLKFTVHDGDLKQGSGSLCDAGLYAQ